MSDRTVVYVHDSHGFGGMELYLLSLMEHIAGSHYRPMLLVPGFQDEYRSSPRPLIAGAEALGVTVLQPASSSMPSIPGSARELLALVRLLQRVRPEIVHIHTCRPEGARKVTLAAKLSRVPVVIRTEHMPPHVYSTASTASRIRLFDRMTDYVVTGSEGDRVEQIQFLGRDPSKVVCCRNSIDWRSFDPDHDVEATKQSLGLDPTVPVIGTVGRLVEQKGHRYLLEAVPHIVQAQGPVNVVVVGSGPLAEDLALRARRLGIESYVHFFGHQTDIRPFAYAMDVAVMPSLWEVFSLAMLEFMAMGKALVTSDHSSFREGLVNGVSGAIVPAADPERLALAVEDLLQSPEKRRIMGRNAMERVRACYGIDRLVRDMVRLYDVAITSGTSSR